MLSENQETRCEIGKKRDKQSVGKVIWELKGFSADGGMVVIFNCHLLGKKENVHAYRDRILK